MTSRTCYMDMFGDVLSPSADGGRNLWRRDGHLDTSWSTVMLAFCKERSFGYGVFLLSSTKQNVVDTNFSSRSFHWSVIQV